MAEKSAAPKVKKKASKMKAKRKKQKRFVIVLEGTYLVFGPFKVRSEAEEYLKERGFIPAPNFRWALSTGSARARISGVTRPKPVKKQDNPAFLK